MLKLENCVGVLLKEDLAATKLAREACARGARMALGISRGTVRTLRMVDIVGQLGREEIIEAALE